MKLIKKSWNEKGSGVCTVDTMVNSLKDMLALSIATLRPLASKHGVRQCGKNKGAGGGGAVGSLPLVSPEAD